MGIGQQGWSLSNREPWSTTFLLFQIMTTLAIQALYDYSRGWPMECPNIICNFKNDNKLGNKRVKFIHEIKQKILFTMVLFNLLATYVSIVSFIIPVFLSKITCLEMIYQQKIQAEVTCLSNCLIYAYSRLPLKLIPLPLISTQYAKKWKKQCNQ